MGKLFPLTCGFFILLVEVCLYTKNKRKPFIFKDFRLFSLWVEGGARTHDIQNHNLTL